MLSIAGYTLEGSETLLAHRQAYTLTKSTSRLVHSQRYGCLRIFVVYWPLGMLPSICFTSVSLQLDDSYQLDRLCVRKLATFVQSKEIHRRSQHQD